MLKFSTLTTRSISSQLEDGIRYFDLKVSRNANDKQIYCSFNFFGPKIEEVVKEFIAFAKAHPKEILILDFNQFYNFQSTNHHELKEMLEQIFEGFLVDSTLGPTATLNDVWETDVCEIRMKLEQKLIFWSIIFFFF